MANCRELHRVIAQVFRGTLKPLADRVFLLEGAQRLLADGEQFGELVLAS